MAEKIKILIVDDLPETRENVRKLLQFESDMQVIGQAGNGEKAIELAKKQNPDIVLMDINMPGIDGIGASREITQSVSSAQIIIMSVQSEADYLRRAMLAGARDFLMKPFSGEELTTAIRRVYENRPVRVAPVAQQQAAFLQMQQAAAAAVETGHVISVYSPKGGSGCSTIAVNTAVGLAHLGHKTLLIDMSLQFGSIDVMLNMKPVASVIDLIENIEEMDPDFISSITMTHEESGLQVLLSPPRPEMAELVTAEHIEPLLTKLRTVFSYIVIDMPSALNPVALNLLDQSDRVLLVTRQTLTTLKNVSRFFNLTEDLEYSQEKVMMLVNQEQPKAGISSDRIASILKRPVMGRIPDDSDSANKAADRGKPLVVGQWEKTAIALSLLELSQTIIKSFDEEEIEEESTGTAPPSKSGWGSLFGGR